MDGKMKHRLTAVIYTALLCDLILVAHASNVGSQAYMPLVTGPVGPITVLRPPVDFLLDSPVLATDRTGSVWLVVQASIGEEHQKMAIVYRVLPNGGLVEMERDGDIYAKPRFAEVNGNEVVYGADEDGNIHVELVEGWTP